MLVSNKHFTPVIGLDIHIVILFGFPIPLPHPYLGFVIDPMDYIPFLGATTKVNHVPRGKSDTSGIFIILFHIPMGGPFLLAPMIGHDSVNFFGSKTVTVEGNLMSPSGHMLMTCNDIGIPLSLQPGKKLKPIPSMYLPTSFSIPLSFGKPVMVGGPFVPDWSGALLNLIASFGFGALMKGLGKGLKRLGKAAKKLKKSITEFNLARQKRIGGSDKLSRALCKMGFEPVDLVQGIVVYDGTDFELPGPLPLVWTRSWNSDSPHHGLLGHGNHMGYDMRILEFTEEETTGVLLGDGRSTTFEILPFPGDSDYNRSEKLTLTRTDIDEYLLYDHRQRLSYHFRQLFPSEYRLYAIRNITDATITFHYNTKGALKQVIDSAGRKLFIENDHEGRITKVTARHRGQEQVMISYTYNEAGDLTGITDALEQTTSIQYRNHKMVSKTDRNGFTFQWEYDNKGRCIHTWGDGGLLEGWIEYHKGYNIVTNSLGQTTTYYYTPDHLVTQITDEIGTKYFEYTPDNEIYREIDEDANITGYSYDDNGNCTSIAQPDGSAFTFIYDSENRLLVSSQRTYIYYKDERYKGLIHTITEADGTMSVFRYNEKKQLIRVEDADGKQTLLSYDEDQNLCGVTLPNGGKTSATFDAFGNCITTHNAFGHEQYYQYDKLNRVTAIDLRDGNHIQLQYNAYEEVIQLKDKYNDIRLAYTPMGNVKIREQNGAKMHYLYDSTEQLVSVINQIGEACKLHRNQRGFIIRETGFDGAVRTYERDHTGKIARVIRPGKQWTEFEYNYNGDLTRSEHSDGSWETFSYDRAGRLIELMNEYSTVRLKRDNIGRVIEEWQNGHVVNSTYDRNGRRTNVQSSLGADIQMGYNDTGDVTHIQAGDSWKAHIERNMLGLETARILPGGVNSVWTYSTDGQIESHTVSSNGRNNRRRHYRWNANGQLKQIINGISNGIEKFGHDEMSNLTWAQYEDGHYDYRTPDKTGNFYRTKEQNDRKYQAGGRLTETADTRYQYNEEGQLVRKTANAATWEYQWYGNGLLKTVLCPDGKKVDFRYDPFGRRIEKQYNGQITRFVWDGNKLLHEWIYAAKDRPVTTVGELGDIEQNHPEPVPGENLTTWVFEAATYAPVAKLINGRQYAIISDHLGTPCEAYNEQGKKVWQCELDIYGKVRKFAGDKHLIPFRYPGQYEDAETGLYYNRFRYYTPDEGRYISQDPIGLTGGTLPYGYVNNPLNSTDVLGLWGDDDVGRLIGARARASIVDQNRNILATATNVSDPDIAHAEIRALGKLAQENDLTGKDILISGVMGRYTKSPVELPTAVCTACRVNLFDILQREQVANVYIPDTRSRKRKGYFMIPASNFANVQKELAKHVNIEHDTTRSNRMWKVLEDNGVKCK